MTSIGLHFALVIACAACATTAASVSSDASNAANDSIEGFPYADAAAKLREGVSRFGDGRAHFIVWTPPEYSPQAESPLIVDLHGGGHETDMAASREIAKKTLRLHVASPSANRFVWIAPMLRRSGSSHAWAVHENALDIIDGILEVRKRLRIDDSRVYLTGASMGAGGAATLSWTVPDAFAAYAMAQGYYWNEVGSPTNLTGVAYRVIHGADDREYGRLDRAVAFRELSERAGATVDLIVLPNVGHVYPRAALGETNAWLLTRHQDGPTDWNVVQGLLDAALSGPPPR